MEEYQNYINYNDFNFKTSQANDNSLNIDNNNLNLENYNYHYICPKCFTIPEIIFIDENNISFKCSCMNTKINIKDLFNINENKYLTIFDNDKLHQNK